jgi:hypothetical protein
MSADNCLAILGTTDGTYRVADIKIIWLNEPDRLPRLMGWAEDFHLSTVFPSYDAAYDYADEIIERSFDDGRIIEYGIEPYDIEMTWEEFYAQAQATGHWRGVGGRCGTCQDQCYGTGRKFENLIICGKCYKLFLQPV